MSFKGNQNLWTVSSCSHGIHWKDFLSIPSSSYPLTSFLPHSSFHNFKLVRREMSRINYFEPLKNFNQSSTQLKSILCSVTKAMFPKNFWHSRWSNLEHIQKVQNSDWVIKCRLGLISRPVEKITYSSPLCPLGNAHTQYIKELNKLLAFYWHLAETRNHDWSLTLT